MEFIPPLKLRAVEVTFGVTVGVGATGVGVGATGVGVGATGVGVGATGVGVTLG